MNSLEQMAAALILDEISRCKQSFEYFTSNHWVIDHRDGGKGLLDVSPEQRTVNKVAFSSRRAFIIKARKLGISTDVAALGVWLAKFHGKKVALVVHEPGALAEVYATKIRQPLAAIGQFDLLDYRCTQNNLDEIRFANGGSIRIGTPNKEPWRGGDIHLCHFSEFSSYDNPKRVMDSALDAMFSGGIAIIETTAKGLGFTHQLWNDADTPWTKLFFSWMLHPLYRVSCTPEQLRAKLDALTSADNRRKFERYAEEHSLDTEQRAWALDKLGEKKWDWTSFHREFPATPNLAFSSASGRVFFPEFGVGKPSEGWLYAPGQNEERPRNGHKYVLGIDAASGDRDGDFTAMCLTRGTTDKPVLVATGYFHKDTNEAAEEADNVARRYGAMIVGERNGYGLALLQKLVERGFPSIWREMKMDVFGHVISEKLGYSTNVNTRPRLIAAMQRTINADPPAFDIWCPRLQREINDFRYNEDTGKAEAAPGSHDDMLFAWALAVIGLDPEFLAQHRGSFKSRPRTAEEIALWEIRAGKTFDPGQFFDDDTVQERENAQLYRGLGNTAYSNDPFGDLTM